MTEHKTAVEILQPGSAEEDPGGMRVRTQAVCSCGWRGAACPAGSKVPRQEGAAHREREGR